MLTKIGAVRLTLNVAGYYIDRSNQIVRALGATFATLNANAGRTTVKGVEVEMRARPALGLDITEGLAYTDSAYDKYTFGTLALLGMNPVRDGTRLQFVSKSPANACAEYVVPLSSSINDGSISAICRTRALFRRQTQRSER